MSEVSAQLRQIQLRQITSKIGTRLYRTTSDQRRSDLQAGVEEIVDELDDWRGKFPLVLEPRNIYESPEWRDLNYFRERLKCFRLLMLAKSDQDAAAASLDQCHQATSQIAILYRSMRANDKLIMNWTCVHDMMSAGFTNLYCSIVQRDITRYINEVSASDVSSSIQRTTAAIIDTLSYISEKWPSVKKHASVFKALASRVEDSIRPTEKLAQVIEVSPVIGTSAEDTVGRSQRESGVDHHAEMWDAAMVAFLDEPLDLGNIDWGSVDWDSMELLNNE